MEGINIDIRGNISLKEFDSVIDLVRNTLINKGFNENNMMSCMIAMSVCDGKITIPITISIGEG